MKRVVVLHRHYWKPYNPNKAYEVCTLKNLTDKQLAAKMEIMNAGFRTSTWSVKRDFHLDKKSDQKAYLQYCIECFYEPYWYDVESGVIGEKMVRALDEDFPYFKKC